MAFLYNEVGSQIDLFPLEHLVGVSNGLFLAIYDKVFQALGGRRYLNKITRKRLQDAICFCKAEADCEGRSGSICAYGRGHIFLKMNICKVDCEAGLVSVNVTFPIYGEAFLQSRVIRRVRDEIKMPGGITTDYGDINFVIALRGEEKPYKAPPFDRYQRLGFDGSFHVTARELREHYTVCANSKCSSPALWLDKKKGTWYCEKCSATNSSLPGE